MSVVHVNTADIHGGAARAAYRLHNGMIENDVSSFMVVRHQRLGEAGIIRAIPREDERGDSRDAIFKLQTEHVQKQLINKRRSDVSGTIFSFPYPGLDLIDLPLIAFCDIVHLHWVNGFMSPVTIGRLGQRKGPIVWTLHDEWPFTGGAHYTAGCTQHITGSDECSQIEPDLLKISKAVLNDKLALWKDLDLTIVSPSQWMADRARESLLFKNTRIEVLPNAVETGIFRPLDKAACRAEFGIEQDATVFAFGAQKLTDRRKGFGALLEALKIALADPRFGELAWKGKIALLAFGLPNPELKELGVDLYEAGNVEDDGKLVRLLNCADAVIIPSIEDNYPNVMIEAMSCGVPVIAYDAGGVSDGVKHGERGLLVTPPGSPEALAETLVKSVTDKATIKSFAGMGKAARKWIAETHGLKGQAKRMIDLYEDIMPSFGKGVGRTQIDVIRASMDKDTRKTPYKVRQIAEFGPGFDDPILMLELRRAIDEIRDRQPALALPPVDYDKPFVFSGDPIATSALGFGWGRPEANGVWSVERAAKINLFLKPSLGDVEIFLDAFCFGANPHRAKVTVNGKPLGEFKITSKPGAYKVVLPKTVASLGGPLEIMIELPDAARPTNSADTRMLSIKLQSIKLVDIGAVVVQTALPFAMPQPAEALRGPAEPLQWGARLRFGSRGTGRKYLAGAWREAGKTAAKSPGEYSSILFRAAPASGNVRLVFDLVVTGAPGTGPETLRFWSRGKFLGSVNTICMNRVSVRVEVPREFVNDHRAKEIVVDLAQSERHDARNVRLALFGVSIEDGLPNRARADGRSPDVSIEANEANYDWGEVIDFSAGGDSWSFAQDGWGYQEDGWRWTVATKAVMTLANRQVSTDKVLSIKAAGARVGNLGIPLTVEVNGQDIWTGMIAIEPQDYNILIPQAALSPEGRQEIVFKVPHAMRPQNEQRLLGLRMMSMQVTEVSEAQDKTLLPSAVQSGLPDYAFGQVVDLSTPAGMAYMSGMWSQPFKFGAIALGPGAELMLSAPSRDEAGKLVISAGGGCSFAVSVDGETLWSGEVAAGLHKIEVEVPAGALARTMIHEIRFQNISPPEPRDTRYFDGVAQTVGVLVKSVQLMVHQPAKAEEPVAAVIDAEPVAPIVAVDPTPADVAPPEVPIEQPAEDSPEIEAQEGSELQSAEVVLK